MKSKNKRKPVEDQGTKIQRGATPFNRITGDFLQTPGAHNIFEGHIAILTTLKL